MGKGSLAVSSTRQQQLLQDRLRTKAISKYIQEHREELLKSMSAKLFANANQKRRELERVGREWFRREPLDTQGRFITMASASTEPSAAADNQQLVLQRIPSPTPPQQLVLQRIPSPAPPAAQKKTSPTPPAAPKKTSVSSGVDEAPGHEALVHVGGESAGKAAALRTSVTVDSEWVPGHCATPLHDRWVGCAKILRAAYGDATSFEVLAAGIRILDIVDWQSVEFRGCGESDNVKLAAVAEMAAKQKVSRASVKDNHVIALWTKIAGKSSERQVRAVEKRLLLKWARYDLE